MLYDALCPHVWVHSMFIKTVWNIYQRNIEATCKNFAEKCIFTIYFCMKTLFVDYMYINQYFSDFILF